MKHAIALLELNLMHHEREYKKFNTSLMHNYALDHKNKIDDINSALKILKQ